MDNTFYPELLHLIRKNHKNKKIYIANKTEKTTCYYLWLKKKKESTLYKIIYSYIFTQVDEWSTFSYCGHFVLEGDFITESSGYDYLKRGFNPDINQILEKFFIPSTLTLFQLMFKKLL